MSRSAVLISILVIVALSVLPASAAPSSVAVEAVFRASGCDPVCDPDQGGLDERSRVSGVIQIHVSAESDVIGLGFVRLEAQTGDDPFYYCIQQWDPQGREFSGYFDWNTQNWTGPKTPGWGCRETSPHHHGRATDNGLYRLRVTASEAVNNEEASSTDFEIGIENRRSTTASSPTPSTSRTAGRSSVAPSAGATLEPTPTEAADPGTSRSPSPIASRAGTFPSVTAAGGPAAPGRSGVSRAVALFLATVGIGATSFALVSRIRARPGE